MAPSSPRGRGVCYNPLMRIAAAQGCVSVRIADGTWRRQVEQVLTAAGLETDSGHAGRGPELVCVAAAPSSAHGLAEVVSGCSGEGPLLAAVVLLAADGCGLLRTEALDAGAAELLAWPAQAAELPAVLRGLTRRRQSDLDTHPLTGLPGGVALHEALARCRGGALLAVDIDRFKAFNDCYGFARGDEVLRYLGRLLRRNAGATDRVFHLGGDDFFVLTAESGARSLAGRLVARFDENAASFYEPDDRARGYVVGVSRETGEPAHFELMSLSVVVATLAGGPGESVCELAARVARLKLQGKARGHSPTG